MTDHAVTARERVARAWHEVSDHADHSPFGGPLCNCDRVAERIIPMLRDAFYDGADAACEHVFSGHPGDLPNPYGLGGENAC